MMRKHIVCLGDSNTYGYDAQNGGRFDDDTRWTRLLQKYLGEDYLVIEEGLGGRTTVFVDPVSEDRDAISYINPCLLSHGPIDLLIIMLGTNDTKERFGVTPEIIGKGLSRLIQKARTARDAWKNGIPDILIVTPQYIAPQYAVGALSTEMGSGCDKKSEALSKVFPMIAAENGCEYLDANDVVKSEPNTVDYMHLTAEGHRELAKALSERIPGIIHPTLHKSEE